MADEETSIGAIRKRTTKLLSEWGADFSVLLKDLEEKRARLKDLEASAAGQSTEVEALNKRIEAQDALIKSLNSEADATARLKAQIHSKDLELEKKTSEINSKHQLIDALRQDVEGAGRLKGDGEAKDQAISQLKREKQEAQHHAAKLTEEFKILTASTLTGVDAVAELDAIRSELDARKSLIESLRGDAERSEALDTQLEEKRHVISTLETSIDRHVSTIAELKQSVNAWKSQYVALKSLNPSEETISDPAVSEPMEKEQQAPGRAEDVGEDQTDATTPHDMRDVLSEAQQMARTKKTVSG